MTIEHLPPEPHEPRWSRWWPFDSAARTGRLQSAALTIADAGPAVYVPGQAARAAVPELPELPGTGPVIEGEVVSDDQRAVRELVYQKEQAVAERLPLSPAFRRELRMQLADFAERAHQRRLNAAGPEMLGSGGGITEVVVQAMAEAISTQRLPAPAVSQEDREDLLLGALAATDPKEVGEAGQASFVTLRGRLMLDVSTAAIERDEPSMRLVALPCRSAAHHQDGARPPAAGQDEARQDGTDRDGPGPRGEGEQRARYAAVICGPAAIIADGRPFLGMDALTTYARRQAFGSVTGGIDPQAARSRMRAAHGIEIVVLLDRSLDGGVWVDVDPATGCPAAAMSIAVRSAGFRFTPLTAA